MTRHKKPNQPENYKDGYTLQQINSRNAVQQGLDVENQRQLVQIQEEEQRQQIQRERLDQELQRLDEERQRLNEVQHRLETQHQQTNMSASGVTLETFTGSDPEMWFRSLESWQDFYGYNDAKVISALMCIFKGSPAYGSKV